VSIQVLINGIAGPQSRYLGWEPVPCVLRTTGLDRLRHRSLTLRNSRAPGGGQLLFYSSPDQPGVARLTLDLRSGSGSAKFWVGGQFGFPSKANGDTRIVVFPAKNRARALLKVPCMVRVRKNANSLTGGERDRFIAALAQLNNLGAGPFQVFRDMHVAATSAEAHGREGFLPWHRAYLLDLERELQAIDPSVALPYWRFDQPAPQLFRDTFIGVSDSAGAVQFSPTNPLRLWVTDGVPGINRSPEFDTATEGAAGATEAATLASGTAFGTFRTMEGNPHGSAHVSFGGVISSVPTAARDPLFFLLHANVDRLWAKWQWLNDRFDESDPASFSDGTRIGHRRADTMWPWNEDTASPRPPTAPGGGLAMSPLVSAPGVTPTVGQMLDYQGKLNRAARLGFDYDDVPRA